VVDESDIFGGVRDDNYDLLRALIYADHLGRDLDLGVRKLLAIAVLLPRSRDTWSPLAKREATGALTTTPTPTDGTNVTVHSKQERGNRVLTQHDPDHSTTTTLKGPNMTREG
jgi:hypothetical protein